MANTEHANYHVALVFYPWTTPYPLENKQYTKSNLETGDSVIFASNGKSISGITSIQYSRKKAVGGSMTVEFTGYIQEEPKLTIGTWCFLATSHTAPIDTMKKIQEDGLVRFIGQVYEINSQYFVDPESGRLARKVVFTIREWCHVLHCPLRYHPSSTEGNLNAIAQGQALAGAENDSKKRAELIQKIGSSMTNVFQQPHIALAWAGGLDAKSSESFLSVTGIQTDDLTLFSTTIARLPVLPEELLTDLGFKGVPKENPWAKGFMQTLSGVQNWGKGGDGFFFGKKLKVDMEAQRPVSPTMLDFFLKGYSLYTMVSQMVAGGGGTETFADLWYELEDGKWSPRPVFVVRDIPFTLKNSEKVIEGSASIPWTYFDDLPRVQIPSTFIQRINLSQSLHNTSNLIQMAIANPEWSKIAQAQALNYFGTTVLHESQKRFGAQGRPPLSITDLFMPVKPPGEASDGVETSSSNSAIAQKEYKVKELIETGAAGFEWFNELTKKQIQWFGSDYLFPSCSLMVKDASFPLAAGINIAIELPNGSEYVGHCDGFSQAFMVDASGRIVNNTSIQLSRLCLQTKDGLMPMSHRSIVNFLNQGSPIEPDALYSKVEKKAFEEIKGIDTKATRQLIKSNNDALTKVVEAKAEESRKVKVDVLSKAPKATESKKSQEAATKKSAKRKPT